MSLKDVIVGLLKTIMTPLKNGVWEVLKLTCLTKSYQTKNKIFKFWGKYEILYNLKNNINKCNYLSNRFDQVLWRNNIVFQRSWRNLLYFHENLCVVFSQLNRI